MASTTGIAKYAEQALDYILPHTYVASDSDSAPHIRPWRSVLLQGNYDTSPGLFPLTNSPTKFTDIGRGDIVEMAKGFATGDLGSLYRYKGPVGGGGTANIDLDHVNFNDGNWVKVSGKPGSIYEYMGGTAETGPLSQQDFTDLSLWKEVPATALQPVDFNIKPTGAIAATAMFVVNDVVGGASATINGTTVTASAGRISRSTRSRTPRSWRPPTVRPKPTPAAALTVRA